MSFLKQCAQKIIEAHDGQLEGICIVLPSKRAANYLRRELASALKKPFWSPTFMTMQELFQRFSGLEQYSSTEALFAIYDAYVAVNGEQEADDLGTFINWGPALLKDINEVDNYLLDPIPFFQDLKNIKGIEQWSLGEKDLTKDQIRFTQLWEEQGKIYKKFSDLSSQMGLATYGAMGRRICEHIDSVNEPDEIRKYWFIGLNALSKSEATLIKALVNGKRAACLWDLDEHYFINEAHEAGAFLRKDRLVLPGFDLNDQTNGFRDIPRSVTVTACSNDLEQVRSVSTIIGRSIQDGTLDKTVVIVPDQSLLPVLLMSLPPELKAFNITMGVPLRYAPNFDLLRAMISLHEKKDRSGNNAFHYKDVEDILNHPIVSGFANNIGYRRRSAYLSPEDLDLSNHELGKLLTAFFRCKSGVSVLMAAINDVLEYFAENQGNSIIQREFHIHALSLWNGLLELQKSTDRIDSVRTLLRLTEHFAREHEITFIGEPLQGLQIMGVLETRALDFEHVIYLSMNEGVMPKEDRDRSFIPYDLRSIYGLPGRSERASVQAYNFYRSIQRAKRVHLHYKAIGTSNNTEGPSRYIAQLEYDTATYDNFQIQHNVVKKRPPERKVHGIAVDKSEDIIEKLEKLITRGLSPSAMSTFLSCPLDFYYKYVLSLRRSEDHTVHLDIPGLGTAVHEAAELLMTPLIGKSISGKDFTTLRSDIPVVAEKAFKKVHPSANITRGQDLLHFEIISKFLRDYVSRESERTRNLQFEIYSLEEPLTTELPVSIRDRIVTLKLKGKADRIDVTTDGILLIDLKSGRVDQKDLSVRTIEDILDNTKLKVLQLLTYAYMIHKQHHKELKAAIFPFGNSSQGLLHCSVNGSSILDNETFSAFEQTLSSIIKELLDVTVPFTHNDQNKYCEFCLNS